MAKGKIYTATGDAGTTSLVGGKRVLKTDNRLEAYGTVDELNAYIGWLMEVTALQEEKKILRFVQNKLFAIGSNLATDTSVIQLKAASIVTDEDVEKLEKSIDRLSELTPPFRGFVLPGGSLSAAAAHICRTVCRRAERRIYALTSVQEIDENLRRFVNRLSDYLFVLARAEVITAGKEEIIWDKDCK